MQQNKSDVSNQEILEAINTFADHTERRFEKIEKSIGNLEGKMGNLETRMGGIEGRVGKIEATMVTKDYLDERLGDLKTDLVTSAKKQDSKFISLVQILKDRKVITAKESAQFI